MPSLSRVRSNRSVCGALSACLSLLACSGDQGLASTEATAESSTAASPSVPASDASLPPPPPAPASPVLAVPASGGAQGGAVFGQPRAANGEEIATDPSTAERFDAVGTNPFVMTAHDPLSTFAIDVDTASYDLFLRDASEGSKPDPASVRLEEYVNFFHYDYPAASFDSPEPFSLSLAAAPNLLDTATRVLRVGIQGKSPPPETTRPANLVFLVDVSGSMTEELPLVQTLLRQALGRLQPQDHVSIVSYASDTRVRLESTLVANRDEIVGAIDALQSGGSTAGASGIALAYDQARLGFIEDGLNHVVLCTDGDFNVGPSSNQELLDLIREERRSGVTLTALGFGQGNYNDAMLEAVSNAGNGFYSYIGTDAQAEDYVSRRLMSTISLIARDVKVQVEFNPEQVAAYRLLGYENRDIADADFRSDIVDAGEIGAGHQVTALYELVLRGDSLPDAPGAPAAQDGAAFDGMREVEPESLVKVKVRYKGVDAREEDPAFEVNQSLGVSAIAESLVDSDADMRWAVSVAALAELLKGSPYARPTVLEQIGAVFSEQAARDADRAGLDAAFNLLRPEL